MNKIPFRLIGIVALLGVGYLFFEFESEGGILSTKKNELVLEENEIKLLNERLEKLQVFYQELETKKESLKSIVMQVKALEAQIGSNVPESQILEMLQNEAKESGLVVQGITPKGKIKTEISIESPYRLKLRGSFGAFKKFGEQLKVKNLPLRMVEFELKPENLLAEDVNFLSGFVEVVVDYFEVESESEKGSG